LTNVTLGAKIVRTVWSAMVCLEEYHLEKKLCDVNIFIFTEERSFISDFPNHVAHDLALASAVSILHETEHVLH
jgi:hypothetical protein